MDPIEAAIAAIAEKALVAGVEVALPILEEAIRKLEESAIAKSAGPIDRVVDVLEDAKFPKG